MNICCYIVDDEPLAIEVLQSHIEQYGQIKIVDTFQNAITAFKALQNEPVDLIFLDIQMPGLTGIDLLKSLKNPPDVIFTTAYREFALEGFELDVVDYLLKPISFERFLKAVGKTSVKANLTGESRSTTHSDDPFLFVRAGKKMAKIKLTEILYVESQKDYVKIVTESKDVKTRQQISTLEDKLSQDRFIRIHRSFIVALKKIESWSASEIEVHKKTLPIGRTYKREVIEKLESFANTL